MRVVHRNQHASLRALRTVTPARCPVGRPSSHLSETTERCSRGDRRVGPFYAPNTRDSIVAVTPLDPAFDRRTYRKARSSGRDHGERHFGARNPVLRGNADLRTLLARRPLLHAGLHLHDRERRGREVSAVFANESFIGAPISMGRPVAIGGSPGAARKGIRRGHVGGRSSWREARASGHPNHRLSESVPTLSRRRGPEKCSSRSKSRASGGAERLHVSETTLPSSSPAQCLAARRAGARAEPTGMHRRAVVLADSKSMQEAPEQGMGPTWQGRPVPPNLLVDRAKKADRCRA